MALKAPLALKVQQDLRGRKAPKEIKVTKESQELELLATQVRLAHKGLQGLKELLDQQELPSLERQGLLAHRGQQDLRDLLALLDQLELQVLRALRAHQESKA